MDLSSITPEIMVPKSMVHDATVTVMFCTPENGRDQTAKIKNNISETYCKD